MKYLAEGTLVVFDIFTVATLLLLVYLRFGRQDQRRYAIVNRRARPPAPADFAWIGVFGILVVAALAGTHVFIDADRVFTGILVFFGGLTIAGLVHLFRLSPLIRDQSVSYIMLMWAGSATFTLIVLAVLAWLELRLPAGSTIEVGPVLGALIQAGGIVISALMLLLTQRYNAAEARRSAGRAIYQNLEFASVEFFRFERQNPELVALLWIDEEVERPLEADVDYELEQYLCQFLNLFEMAFRFRREGIVPEDVFASWLIWMYEVCCRRRFRDIWTSKLRPHYIASFRELIDAGLRVSADEVPRREDPDEPTWHEVQAFYLAAAELVSPGDPCTIIEDWLEKNAGLLRPDANRRISSPAG